MAEQKKTTRKSGSGTTKTPAKSTAVKKNTNGKTGTGKSSSPKSQHKGNAKVIDNDSRFGDSILDEVILIIIMLISLVAEISVLTEKMGVIGHLFSSLFKGLFGFAGVLLPLCIIIYCGWLLASEERKMPVVRGLGGLLFLLCVAAGVHLIHPIEAEANLKFFQRVGFYYGEGAMGNGGLFGVALGGMLYGAFDTLGSTLVLIALLIISFIMATGKSFFQAVSDYSAHQKAMQKVRQEKIKSRAEQIRLMEQAEAEKRERRRQREKKKGSYNIELRDEEGCEVETPEIEETVFRKKDPIKLKKADPIYNFIFQEEQEGADQEEVQDFEIESVSENQQKDEEIPIMIHSKAVQDEGDEMIEEIFRETPEKEILLSEEEEVFSQDGPLGKTEEIPIVVLDEEAGGLNASDDLDMSESVNISDDLEITVDADDLADAQEKEEQEKTAKETETVPEEEVPVEPIEEEIPYVFPPIELLGEDPKSGGGDSKAEMLANAKKLESTLKSFGVDAKVIQINRGPTVTRYELSPSQGVKVSKIVNLADDIALNLAASGIRIEAPIPGKAAVGIEVPNRETQSVYLRTVLDSDAFHNHGSKLAFALGEDIAGNPVVTDIGKMPHLLIAGATGSGKSVCINTLITSILYKADPKDVKLLLVDPKVVELSVYNGIPHLLIPVVTDPKKASAALNWAVREMLQRYNDFAAFGVRDIKGFNAMKEEEGDEKGKMAQIVIVIDELADLMMAAPGEVEDSICRLAQMARAAGMHLIIATQRPSVDVITGVIKANIPSRLAFAVSSGIDSRTILDMVGAEKLLGKGDMLFYPAGQSKPARLQGAFVTDKEVEDIVSFLKKSGRPGYTQDTIDQITKVTKTGMDADEDSDEFFEPAVDLIIEKEKASVSMLQRQFRIGYNRAARLMDELERKGMVGSEDGSKPRKVLITRAQWETIKEPVDEEI